MSFGSQVWLNGRLVPLAEANTPITAFTLHYGIGAFEGVRCYRRADGRSAIFRLREHVDRLFESARVCEMEMPYTPDVLASACAETVRANGLPEAYIRPIAYVGAGALGLGTRNNPTEVAVVVWPWSGVLGADAARDGVRAHVSTFVRGHMNAAMSKAKIIGGYASSVLAKRESQRLGFDECIMLDADGRVAEGSAQNVFVVWKGTLYTPPLDMPILAGITRDAVLTLARGLDLPVVERSVTRDMLLSASEIFFTGTATEMTPVREVDGRQIGDGRPGPITRRLQETFWAAARGPGESHPEWLTYL